MQYMEAARGDEDPESTHSDEEEDGDLSTDNEAIPLERDGMEERVGPEPEASAEDRGLDPTARRSSHDRGGQEETVIIRTSSVDEPLKEGARSSTGSGAPSVARSVSVKTGLRNLKVSEGDIPDKGERTAVTSLVKTRGPRLGFSVVGVCSDVFRLPFDSSTPEANIDRGGKVEVADLGGDQDSGDDSADDEEGTGRQVTSSRVKERVATEVTRDKNRQRKYHTKKSAQRSKGGRDKGSKAKNSAKQQVASAGWF